MAIEKHVIQLTAKDTVSPAFQKIGREADTAGKKAEEAGRKGTKGSNDWAQAAGKVGLALGALSGIAIKLANESEVSQSRLEQSIENTGAAYVDLEDQIDAATDAALKLGFDDEDAVDALSKLTDATGDAEKAIDDLAIAQDVARARGISLAAATDMIIAAETGRYRSLKSMGIVLGENATAEEALSAIQSKVAGQAEAYAETNQAAWDRMGNTIENHMEALGGALADFQGPLIALGAGSQLLGPLGSAFESIGGKAKIASLATTVMSSSWMGPAGLAVGAVAVSAAIWQLTKDHDDLAHAADRTAEREAYLGATLGDLADRLIEVGLLTPAQNAFQFFEDITAGAEMAEAALETTTREVEYFAEAGQNLAGMQLELTDSTAVFRNELGQVEFQLSRRTYDVLEYIGALNDGVISTEDMAAAQVFMAGNFEASKETLQAYTEAFTTAMGLAADPRYDGSAIIENINNINRAVDAGTITEEQGLALLVAINNERDHYNKTLNETASGFGKATGASVQATKSLEDMAKESEQLDSRLGDLAQTLQRDYAGAAADAFKRTVGMTDGVVASIQTTSTWMDSMYQVAGLVKQGALDTEDYIEAQEAQEQVTKDLTRAQEAAAEIQIKQIDSLAEGTKASADYLENIADMDEAQQGLALAWADTDIAGQAMEVADLAAEFGNMNTKQQAAFENMVTSAAATNPALAGVLEDLGLIEQDLDDPTGWALVIDDSATQTSLADVVTAIDKLTAAILGVPDVVATATLDTGGFYRSYDSLPDSKTIDVWFNQRNNGGDPFQLGGITGWGGDAAAVGMAGRGNVALVGEAGPELLYLPGGSRVEPNSSSRYKMGGGDGGITINGPITIMANDVQSFTRQLRQSAVVLERR